MKRNVGFLIGSVILLVLLACEIFSVRLAPSAAAQAQARREAVARWEARDFLKYRMILEEANCTTDYEVNSERVTWGHEAPCGRGQARSVTNMFALIGQPPDASVCLGANCLCKRVRSIDIRYHATLGYPEYIAIRTQVWPNWQSNLFWDSLTKNLHNPCSGGNERILKVRGLIPRP